MDEELEYIKELETYKLIEIVQDILGFEETSAALLELYNRDINIAFELGIDILDNNKGDDYLQAIVFDIIYYINPNRTLDSICKRKAEIGVVLLGDIMSEMSIDYYSSAEMEMSDKLLYMLLRRYSSLSKYEQEKIINYYMEFEEFLKKKGDLES